MAKDVRPKQKTFNLDYEVIPAVVEKPSNGKQKDFNLDYEVSTKGNGKEKPVEQTRNYDIFLKKQQVPFDIPKELKNIPIPETTPGVVFDSPLTTPARQWYEKPEAKAPELRERPIHSAYEPQPFPELTKKADEISIAENKLNKLADGLKKSKDSINLSDAEQVKLFNDNIAIYNQEYENYQKLVNDYNRSLGTIKSESKSEDDKYLEELRKKQPAYKNIPDSILLHSRNELQGFEPKKIQKYSKVPTFVLGLQDLVTTQIPESVDFTLGLISEGMRVRNPQLSLAIDQTLRQPVQNFVAEQKKIREEYKPQDEFWYSIGNAVGTGAMAYVGGYTGALTGRLLKLGQVGTEILSGVNSFANSFALEGSAAYGDAKQYGLSDQEAMRIGSIVGLVNAPLDVAPVLYGLKKFGLTKAAIKEVQEEVEEKILNKSLRKQILDGVKDFVEQSQIEGITETMQEITPLIQEGLYKRAQDKPGFMDWYNRIGQSYIAGAFVGGLFAGGATTNQIIRENRALEVGELKPGATDLIATTLMNPKLQQEKQFDVRQQFIATQPQEEQSALRDLTGQQINVSGVRGDFPLAQLELTEGRTEGRGRPIEKVARGVQIEQNRRANEELKLLEERKQRQAEKKQKRQEQLDEENYYRLERAVKNAIKNNIQFPEGQIAQLNDQVIKPAVKQKLEKLFTQVLEHNKQAKLGAVEEVKTKTLEPEFADVDKQLAQKEQELLNRIKEAKDAVSKQSPTGLPIQPTPGSSEEIRQGDTEGNLPTPTGTQEEKISTEEISGEVVPKAGEGEVKTGGEIKVGDIKTHEQAISTRDAYMKQLIVEGKTDAEIADAMNKDLPVPTDEALKILRDIVNIEHKLRPAAKVKEELLNRLMPIKSWLNRQYGKLEDLSNEELVNLDKKFISKESQDRIAKLAYDSKDFNEFFGLMDDNDKMVLVAAGKVKYENRSFNADDLNFFYERNKKPEEKPLPSIKEITENVPNIKLVKIKEAESEIDKQIDDKIKQLLKKKGGQLNLSIDPEQLAIGTEIVGLYIKKGVYKLKAILEEVKAKYGFDNLRELFDVIKQAYGAYYSTVADDIANQMDDPKTARGIQINLFESGTKKKTNVEVLRDRIAEEIKAGNQMNKTQLEKLAKEVAGIEDANLAKEIAESAVYKLGREIVTTSKTEEGTLKKLTELYNNQPNLTHRTSESVRNQQYSTPITISYVAGLWVGDTAIKTLESSAGTGLLTVALDPKTVHANEIDPVRRQMLELNGYAEVTDIDASTPMDEIKGKFSGFITNPPFGGLDQVVRIDDYKIRKLEHLMAARGLHKLTDDGRGAIIIGGHNEYQQNGRLAKDEVFFNWLNHYYNVADVININGDLYSKQGTKFPIRLILINGKKSTPSGVAPKFNAERETVINDFQSLYDRVKERRNEAILQPGLVGGTSGATNVRSPGGVQTQGSQNVPPTQTGATNQGGGTAIQSVSGQGGGRTTTQPSGSQQSEGSGTGTTGQPTVSQPNEPKGRGQGEPKPEGTEGDIRGTEGGESDTNLAEQVIKEEKPLIPYEPMSKSPGVDTHVPRTMYFETKKMLERLQKAVGNIDEYVRTKLNYDSLEDLFNAFSGEQIDGLALAIYNIDRGEGMIVGDQTGTGKGRQAAGLIRYANLIGLKPIFMTEKAKLFSDIYRDLVDIGSEDLTPFILNQPDAESNIVDENGTVIHRALSSEQKIKFFRNQDIEGFDFLVSTYSQINSERRASKRGFLSALAQDNILILDESHNAAGEGNTAAYMMGLVQSAKGVAFLSATYAKRPNNMPLYVSKTALNEANLNNEEIANAISDGGVALQEAVAQDLIEAGQMIRREKTFEGIKVEYQVFDHLKEQHTKTADTLTQIMRDIIAFQNEHVRPVVNDLNDDVTAGGIGIAQGTSQAGVDNTAFASKIFNVVNQMLFSIKAEETANLAIKLIKEGKKPIIACHNTMEAFLTNMGFQDEENIGVPDFSRVLQRGLDGVLRISVRDEQGNAEPDTIKVEDLSPEGQAEYHRIAEAIRVASTGISPSPIDIIIKKLEDAGYKIGEITGRDRRLQYNDDGTATVVRRGKVDSKKTLRDFNNQEFDKNSKSIHGFDALIINSSGAAGTSAHTSPKFKDTRPRAMINIQLQLNINTEVQVRGRINRTGQVNLPEYYTVASAIPAEQRMLMMAKKKLRSLDANTQAEQKRAGRYFESVDFINKYGDYIVWEYLKENPDFYNKVYPDDKLDLANKDEAEMADVAMPENIALKASGRVAILSVTEQEEFYNEIQQRYIDLIDYLDQMGENDLEMTFYPLDAKTTHSRILIAGKGGTSPFGRDSIVEDIEINVLKKPWKKEKIDTYLRDELKGKDKGKHRQDILHNFKQHFNKNERTKVAERIETLKKRFKIEDDLTSLVDDIVRTDDLSGMNIDFTNKYFIKNQQIDSESLEGKRIQKINENLFSILSSTERDRDKAKWLIRNVFNEYNIGDVVKIPVVEGSTAYVNGIFAGWDINERSKNPYAPSAIKMKFITSDSRQMVTVPTSKRDFLNAIAAETYRLERFQKEDIFNDWDHNVSFKNREVRQFVTGNLLQGMAEVKHGKLISFSTNDGKIRRGILTPRDWAKGEVNDVKVPIMRAYEIIKNFKNGKSIESWNGNVEIIRDRNNFMVRFPASKKSGGKYYLDETLASLTMNKRFDKIGDSMVGYVKPDNLREFLKVLQNDFGEAVRLSEDELKKISKIYGSNTEQKRENGEDISDEDRLDGNPVDFGMGLGQVFTGFADMVINRFNKRSDLIATGVIKIDDPRFPNALRLYRKFMTNIPWFFDKAPKLQRIYDLIDLHLVRNINEEAAIIREDKWKNAKGYRNLKETEKQEFLNAMKKYEWQIYDDMRRGRTPRYLKFDQFIANYNLSPDTAKWLLTEYKPTIDYALELVKDLDKYSIINETKANPFLQDYRAYAQSKKPDKATLAKLLEAAKKEFFDVAPNAEFHYEQYLINMAKPDEVTALQMVWQNMKDIREISANYLADIKYKELENRFYFPSSRLSNKYYLSAVKEVSIAEALAGEVEDRYYSTSDNISKLKEIKDDLESQGYKVYVGEFKKAQEDILDNIVGQEDLLDLAQLSGIAEDNPVIDRLLKNIMGKGFTRHFIQKKYIPGFEYTSKNFESAMYRYMNSVPYFKNQTIGHKELEKAMVKLKRDKVLKAGSAEDDYIQTMLNGLNTRSSTVSLALRAAASVWYLAGRLSYYAQQIVQPFNTLLPLLPTLTKQLGISSIEAEKAFGSAMLGGVQYYSWKIMDWIARHTGKNYSHNHGLEQEFIDIAKRLDRQGVGKPLRTQELIGERVDPNKYYDVNLWSDPFTLFAKAVNFPGLMIEDFTRAQGMRAFYLLGKKGGLSGEELMKFISLNVAKSYGPPAGRLAKPPGYNIPSKATIAKAAQSVIDFGLTFKNFAFMNYGQWGKTYRALMDDHLFRPIIYKTGAQIGVGGLKYMAWTSTVLSFLSFMFGLLNIPKDPEEEYEKIFLNFNKLIPGMGDAMYKGVASVTFKVDLSNLFSQQAPFLSEDIAWKQSIPQAIGGAPTQVVSDIYNAIESRKLKYLAPMGLRNVVSAQEYGKRGIKMSGRQLIPTEEKYLEEMEKYKRGEIKIKPEPPVTAGEKLAKSLSFQPLRVSEAYEKEKSRLFISAQTSDIIQNEVRDEIVPLIQTGKDLEARQKFIKLYERIQKNNPMTDWQKERITDVDKFISQFVLNRLDDEDRETVKDWKNEFIIKGQRSRGRSTSSRNIGRSTGRRKNVLD